MHFFREFLLKDATKKNLKSYMYSLIYTSGAQAESGSCMCDELMMKDWKGSFFSTDALKSITPKYKSLAGFQTKIKNKKVEHLWALCVQVYSLPMLSVWQSMLHAPLLCDVQGAKESSNQRTNPQTSYDLRFLFLPFLSSLIFMIFYSFSSSYHNCIRRMLMRK